VDVISAFLLVSGIAYYCIIPLPQPTTKNISKAKERIWFFVTGTAIVSLVVASKLGIFSAWWAWMALGIFYTMACILSYLGYTKWNVLWREDLSDEAQMSMWLWDLAIAVSAFAMI